MRFLVGGRLLKVTRRAYRAHVYPLPSRKAGSFTISFAPLSGPFCETIGAGVGFARTHDMQARMQSVLEGVIRAILPSSRNVSARCG